MGVLNLYVAYNFSTNFWVNFKLFGTLGLTILFVILQAIYLMRFDKAKINQLKKHFNYQPKLHQNKAAIFW